MRRPTKTGLTRTGIAALVATALFAGCAGGSGGSEAGLRDGVYEFELTEAYLRENGVPAQHARSESGVHELTLDRGSFVDRWRTADGAAGSCWGVYAVEGNRITFRWTGGCTGDWAMSYSVDGDRVTWSDVDALDPKAGSEEQKVTEVFNGVPWTRTGDVPEEGEK
jgi:hypothetical protein